MRVGFDIDGVLHNFGNGCYDYLVATGRAEVWKSGDNLKPDWYFYKKFREPWTDEEFVQFCNDGVDAGYIFNGHVRDNAVAAVQAVKDAGHEIIVVTDRSFGTTPEVSEQRTIEWWNEFMFPWFDELHFSADKTVGETDIFVEDKIANFEALWDAGTPCYLVTRPWNEDFDAGEYRISDVIEYPKKVEQLALGKRPDAQKLQYGRFVL